MQMQGKTVLITGGSSGIGRVTARELARMGAEVVIVSRSPARCEAAVQQIMRETGSPRVSFIAADLSVMAEVRRAAQEFLATHDALHVLINNAGAMYAQRHVTSEGNEMMLALNHLNYFLLTHLLLDVLKKTSERDGEARIVNVSSEAHRFVERVDFDDLQRQKRFNLMIYNETKLMNLLFTYELAERLRQTNVTANALHPGLVRSGFGKNNNLLVSAFWTIVQTLNGISEEEGAQTSIYAASAPEIQGHSGRYYDSRKERRSSQASLNGPARKRLWQMSELLTHVNTEAAL